MEMQHTRDLRVQKLDRVIRLFGRRSGWTRKSLERETGYSYATVSNILQSLLANDIVREESTRVSTGGRKPVVYRLNDTAARFLSFDIGTARVKWALQDLSGAALQRGVIEDDPSLSFQSVVANAIAAAQGVLQDSSLSMEDIHSVGVGIPGHYRGSDDRIVRSSTERIGSLRLRQLLEPLATERVVIETDSHVSALRDIATLLPQSGDDSVVLYLLVTEDGVGSSIVIRNRVHYGAGRHAGEIHMLPMRSNGTASTLGDLLDFDINKAEAEIKLGNRLSPEAYQELLLVEHEAVMKRYEAIVEGFAETIYLLDNILDPDYVIVSGIYNVLATRLSRDVMAKLKQRAEPHLIDHLELLLAPPDRDLVLSGLAHVQAEQWRQDRVAELQ